MHSPDLNALHGYGVPGTSDSMIGRPEESRSPAPDRTEAQARFTALVGEHLDGLYGMALRLTRNRTTAEDLAQEAMFKAWRSFHTFQEGTSIRAWLHRILMNAFFDAHRKETREPDVVEQEDVGEFYLYEKVHESAEMAEAGNPEVQVLDQIMDAEVRESLEGLPVQFRSAVLLADVQGFSYKEIADILGIPAGTVMSRLSRGRHLLQQRLWEFARDRHLIKGNNR
jgi:RNA polymerase sigma-70 factor, ECF subfamily